MTSFSTTLKTGISRELDEAVSRAREILRSRRIQAFLWALAAVFFLGGLAISLWSLNLNDVAIVFWPLVMLAVVAIPVMLMLNAFETECVARLFNRSFGFWRALRVTVIGSAANMLPLPGAATVRVISLKSLDVPARSGSIATIGVALTWLGMSLVFAGCFLLRPAFNTGLVACLIGLTVLPVGIGLLLQVGSNRLALAGILGVKAALTLLSVLRMMLCFVALGVPVGFEIAAIFAVGRVLGSAASIVPAGLGVRELVSAALAPLVGLPSAIAFVATALDRLTALLALLALSTLFGASSLTSQPDNRS